MPLSFLSYAGLPIGRQAASKAAPGYPFQFRSRHRRDPGFPLLSLPEGVGM